MRWLGMICAFLTLVAVFFGISSLTAFGFDFGQITVILVPMAIGVTLFFIGVTYFGAWTARWMNRGAAREEQGADRNAAE